MPKARNPKADEAEALYNKGFKLIEISKQMELPEGTVRRWKSVYNWDGERSNKKKANVRKSKGAPRGNQNAKGAGAPKKNTNAEKYGFFSKYLPLETLDIVQAVEQANPLDLLWHQIQIAYAAIIRAQKIAYVKDKDDKTIERVEERDGNVIGEKWDVQQAWDKQNSFLKAQARAQGELRSLIKQYDEMLHRDWDMATEEQKSRIELIKAQTAKAKGEDAAETFQDDGFIEALKDEVTDVWED
jgi:uncharacterized protein YjcR|nr:MAG TPA: Terminase small subunit [Caudoviricetes sp.]